MYSFLGWSPWEPWSNCTLDCGGGKRLRKRVCMAKDWWACGSINDEEEDCNMEPCAGLAEFFLRDGRE